MQTERPYISPEKQETRTKEQVTLTSDQFHDQLGEVSNLYLRLCKEAPIPMGKHRVIPSSKELAAAAGLVTPKEAIQQRLFRRSVSGFYERNKIPVTDETVTAVMLLEAEQLYDKGLNFQDLSRLTSCPKSPKHSRLYRYTRKVGRGIHSKITPFVLGEDEKSSAVVDWESEVGKQFQTVLKHYFAARFVYEETRSPRSLDQEQLETIANNANLFFGKDIGQAVKRLEDYPNGDETAL